MGLFRSSEFSSGTRILFQQSTAPMGWTKDAAHNDKSLRVVSGAVTSGGSVSFSAFAAQSVGATTLSIGQIPVHAHSFSNSNAGAQGGGSPTLGPASGGSWTDNNGGGGSHTHSLNMSLQYVDAIICVKN